MVYYTIRYSWLLLPYITLLCDPEGQAVTSAAGVDPGGFKGFHGTPPLGRALILCE